MDNVITMNTWTFMPWLHEAFHDASRWNITYYLKLFALSALIILYSLLHTLRFYIYLYSVQFSCSVMSDSLWPHGLQHARLPCPSPIQFYLYYVCLTQFDCKVIQDEVKWVCEVFFSFSTVNSKDRVYYGCLKSW